MTALDEGLLSFGQNIGEGLRFGANAAYKRKQAQSFMDALLGTPDAAPNFAGPSAPGYSGAAAPANYTPSYSGGVLDGVPGMEKLGPLLSGMNPEDAQAFALPLLLKQFERKPTETYKPGDQVYAAGDYSKPLVSIPEKPDKPAALPNIVQTAQYLFPHDPVKQNQYIMQNSPASVKSIFAPKTPKAPNPNAPIAIPHPAAGY